VRESRVRRHTHGHSISIMVDSDLCTLKVWYNPADKKSDREREREEAYEHAPVGSPKIPAAMGEKNITRSELARRVFPLTHTVARAKLHTR
jgi:hypothetical protein